MKSTLGLLTNPNFASALGRLVAKELPAATSFKLSKILKEVRQHQKDCEESRLELIKKFAELDDAGNPVVDEKTQSFKMVDRAGFDKEFSDLLDVEVEHGQLPFAAISDIVIGADVLDALVGTIITEP